MLFTTHIATGAVAGLLTGNPYAAIAAGLVSHHLLDRVPHYDVGSHYVGKEEPKRLSDLTAKEKLLVLADLVVGVLVLLWMLKVTINPAPDIYIGDLWTKQNSLVLLGAIAAAFPDILYNIAKILENRFNWMIHGKPLVYYRRFHERFHQVLSLKYWYIGILSQLILIGLSVWYILR